MDKLSKRERQDRIVTRLNTTVAVRISDLAEEFDVTTETLLLGAGVALVLMLASGLVPAMRAARLPVVQALRRVE